MVNSRIGSNFHRRSGDDGRRGIFSKLPPLSIPDIPNGLRKLKSNSPLPDIKSSASITPSTSSVVVAIGSILAPIPSRKSGVGSRPKMSTASTQTPASGLPLSALSPPSSGRSSADTAFTTPDSGPSGKTYFPVVRTSRDGSAQFVTWEERPYNVVGSQGSVDGAPILVQRSSKTSVSSKSPRVFDVTQNIVQVDEDLDEEELSVNDLKQLHVKSPGFKNSACAAYTKAKDKTSDTATNWDPSNPGHDTWNESGRDEKWQHRSQLFSNLSAFNMRNAQKRKIPPPKPDVGPMCEAVDSTNNHLTPKDVGGLVEHEEYFMAPEESHLKSELVSPRNTKASESLPTFAEEDETFHDAEETSRLTIPASSEQTPRITVAMPCSDLVNVNVKEHRKQRQSLFDLSNISSVSSEDDEDEEHSPDHKASYSSPAHPVSISVKSRTQKDSLRASILRHTSSTTGAMSNPSLRLVRSRGESIGLPDCSQNPMVLAAGFEKRLRGRGATTSAGGDLTREKSRCDVYRATGNVWEMCPGREAPGVEREVKRKGRARGETF